MRANYNLKKFFDDQHKDKIWLDTFIEDIVRDKFERPYEVDGVMYMNSKLNGRTVRVDECVYEMYEGSLPEGYTLKHLDGDYTNCKISNLKKEKIKK